MTSLLWLVRHGETDWSDEGRLCGWTDVPLNECGRASAIELRRMLAGREFAGAWSSDLARARETAELATDVDVKFDPRLRELNFGELEGKKWDDCATAVREALMAFDFFEAPRGESASELRVRLLAFVRELPEGEHLAFTHGGPIRSLLRETREDIRVRPGEVVVITLPLAGRPLAQTPDLPMPSRMTVVPDSYGKRQRDQTKARKAAAREERRIARGKRRSDREAGIIPEQTSEAADLTAVEGDDPVESAPLTSP